MFRGLSGFRFSKGNLLPVVGFILPKQLSPSVLLPPSHLSVFSAGHLVGTEEFPACTFKLGGHRRHTETASIHYRICE